MLLSDEVAAELAAWRAAFDDGYPTWNRIDNQLADEAYQYDERKRMLAIIRDAIEKGVAEADAIDLAKERAELFHLDPEGTFDF